MVKGKTTSGIKFEIDERIKDDTRLYQYATEMQGTDVNAQGRALFDMLGLIFGGRDGVISFQNTVASVHDGICTSELLMAELSEIMEAVNLKKSSPSARSSTSTRKK